MTEKTNLGLFTSSSKMIKSLSLNNLLLLNPPLKKGEIGGFAVGRLGKIPPHPPLQRGEYYLRISSKINFMILPYRGGRRPNDFFPRQLKKVPAPRRWIFSRDSGDENGSPGVHSTGWRFLRISPFAPVSAGDDRAGKPR